MHSNQLEPGEEIRYRTRYGGDIVAHHDRDRKAAYRADCEVCGDESPRSGLGLVRSWAAEHAAACRALPKDYVDCRAAALTYAEQASALLYELADAPEERHQELLAQADIRARLAATYAELAAQHDSRP